MSAPKPKLFSSYKGPKTTQPGYLDIQYDSFNWFLKKGLRELFDEISPITDHTGKKFELYFLEYEFDEPKYTEAQVRAKDQTYQAALRANIKIINKETGNKDVQEVYLGDFPIMTDRGTFIINGVERVIVSQLIRSPGVYFTSSLDQIDQRFGAKVIPNRGSWLDFETHKKGVIYVKIDRKRKTPATQLLRIFGYDTNDKILDAFENIDTGEIKFIEETLKKDPAKTVDESYLEIYKVMRPGDAASIDNAKNLIKPIFEDEDRYDLDKVGRYKLNQRLGLKNKKGGLLDQEDIFEIIKEIIRSNNDLEALPDDIDHLGNRRIRAVGELLQSRLRVGFARLRRAVQDKMSTLEEFEVQPAQLINYKIITSVINNFMSSSQLSQFMDQSNPLSEIEHKRRLSAMGPGGLTRERAGFEVRDVHTSYYGRICPIQTPEGSNIGLVSYLANYAKLNEFGFIETPYFKVEKGKITNKVDWLDAVSEEKYNIAQSDANINDNYKFVDKEISIRVNGSVGRCNRNEVDYIDVDPVQMISISTSLIPFLEHDDANRALMGSNMQRQAVPTLRPQAPLVGTGVEEKVVFDSKLAVFAKEAGEVIKSDGESVIVKSKSGKKEYPLIKFRRSNDSSCISQSPVVKPGDKVKKDDLLADGPATEDGVLALGQNMLVAFMTWQGTNFEDAILISERVAERGNFDSINIETYTCAVRETKLGPEVTTPDIPNVAEDKLRNLDEEGIIRIGAEVQENDILVGKISPKGETELTSEERLLRAIFGEKARDIKDTSLKLPHGKRGRVISIKVFSQDQGDKMDAGIIKKVQVEIAQIRKIKAGDKLAGRHGNKGVISQVRPVEDMPFLEDGTPVDVVLNPLGVISRMNLGQIFETHLGFAAKKNGYRAVVPNFVGIDQEGIQEELKKAGLPETGQIDVYDGLTGKKFDKPVTVGYIYILKLHHLVEDKIHMRSTGPYSLITQQPLGGKAQLGGQRFGEMEVWALEGYGSAYTLQEMLTIKSDDVLGRSSTFESIIRGRRIKKPTIPASFNVLMNEIRSLGLDVDYESDNDESDFDDDDEE
jgi:DNA-directed RNA polymerase subunit beta